MNRHEFHYVRGCRVSCHVCPQFDLLFNKNRQMKVLCPISLMCCFQELRSYKKLTRSLGIAQKYILFFIYGPLFLIILACFFLTWELLWKISVSTIGLYMLFSTTIHSYPRHVRAVTFQMAPTVMPLKWQLSINRVILVTRIACAALSIVKILTNVGVTACALVFLMATYGEKVVPTALGKAQNASNFVTPV